MEIQFIKEVSPKKYLYNVFLEGSHGNGLIAQVSADNSTWSIPEINFNSFDPDGLDSLVQSDLIRRGLLYRPL